MEKVKTAVSESTMSPDNSFGYQEIDLHIIFDINLRGKFRRKDRLVAVGRKKRPRFQLHTFWWYREIQCVYIYWSRHLTIYIYSQWV